MIKAVIFDLDGVLVSAKDWHFEALNRALRQFGLAISRDDHVNIFDGLPTRKKLEILTETAGLAPEHYEDIFTLKQKFTMEFIEQHCRPYPPHVFALARLKAMKYRLAVASNSTRATVETVLEKTGLRPYLDFILSNQDVQQTKPHPEIYQKAIARLGLLPEECLIIEDNINGIKAAEASGAHLLVVETIHDVTLENILKKITQSEKQSA